MSCTGTSNCDCGCCAGTSVQTPQPRTNLPGLSAISYRVGAWSSFKESMLARLSSSDYPALAALKTRDDGDFTIALLDATAMMLDVLTFYQERLANESYLGTAVQLQSLTGLSRLIGYQPSPGVSASTYMAFNLKTAPGQTPNPSAPAITIPQGTQAQSVPGQGQTPQIFETAADIQATPDWNALPVQTGQPWEPRIGDTFVYLQGTATQLQPGDLFLIVGDDRLENPSSHNWNIRVVTTITPDNLNNRTYVAWCEGLVAPVQEHPKFYAFRQRASLFGYNAINPLMLAGTTVTNLNQLLNSAGNEWNFVGPGGNLVDLDATYSKLVSGGWMALNEPDKQDSGSPSGLLTLYQIQSVTVISRSGYGISGKISRLLTDSSANLSGYYTQTRQTSVIAQSEELAVAEQPLDYPLYGTILDLEEVRPDLVGATVVALSGKRQKISVASVVTCGSQLKRATPLQFVPDQGTVPMTLNPGDILTLTGPTPLPLTANGSVPDWSSSASTITLSVQDSKGRTGTVLGSLSRFMLAPSAKSDPNVSEYALVSSVATVVTPFPHTRIQLQSALLNCYDRNATTVNANVGLATQGQSVSEVMGSGNASTPNQSFTLKQSPLTYVQAPTPTGAQSTLEVQVNGVDWTEESSLYGQGPSQQVFATLNQSDGTADVLFGDGVEGSVLPTGQNNIQANYRIGLGSAGNVGANTLTTLIDRPLGVSGVTNPGPATGGQDPQLADGIRSNAPLTVLTLGRAVSLADYENYAGTFAGIAKAYTIWIPSGPGQGVFLTVAGVNGAALTPGNPTLANLVSSLRNYGNPLISITVQSFMETLFGLSADVQYDPAYNQPTVQAQVLQTLSQAYSFAARTFGQSVSVDEVSTVIQNVPGVIAVNVKKIAIGASSTGGDLASLPNGFTLANWNNWMAQQVTVPIARPYSGSASIILPYLPVANTQSMPLPAEILVLDPDPSKVVLGVMS